MLHIDSTLRFSSRVGNYARCRPSYPPEIIDILRHECGLTADSVIADIASGTGIFTRLLLENGNRVCGVEPNQAMREAGELYLASYRNFTSVCGAAEHTTLPDTSADLVTAAQAAHWFDREKALEEFRRILKPDGYLVLIWNDRRKDAAAFDREYEQLLENFGTDYDEVKRRDNASMQFFGRIPHQLRILRNFQDFDYASLEGRLLSSSYTPQAGHPSHEPMLAELRRIFDAHQKSGTVRMEYDTKVYFGQLVSGGSAAGRTP
jgi:ubiquinone/menaquinone biosynthesis C-methylase UbiE